MHERTAHFPTDNWSKDAGKEQKPPALIRNALVAYSIAYVIDRGIGHGLTPDGHKLLKKLAVKLSQGGKISMSQDVHPVYQRADLSIWVNGQEHIPPSGPTVFVGNHTRGGPLHSIGQYFEVAKEGYDGRFNVEDERIREPFLVMQRGLGKGKLVQYFSGVFYELAARSFNAEVVDIPKYDGKGEVVNSQNLGPGATQRVIEGGALLWYPQGTHRHPDNLQFPQKANGFLNKISDRDHFVQLVPVRAIPDEQGNISIKFGPSVDIGDVVKKGGIDYFTQKHLAPLGMIL